MGRDSGIVVGDVALSEQHKGLYPYNELGIYSTFLPFNMATYPRNYHHRVRMSITFNALLTIKAGDAISTTLVDLFSKLPAPRRKRIIL
ncbi:hypothetical protein [Dickeya ananatis]|uniref:hypothetical protein n=1 Tax=Dickeya ananatis TaxID=3061286 RepID=UPI003890C878